MKSLRWDLFCRVIDNYGDIGVSWRLARDLAARGQRVRLFVDDASALAWMSPGGLPAGIEVLPWDASLAAQEVGDVVIETFGCELPEPFVARMAQRQAVPRWINLEYLSAESYVERSHGLASPQFSGPGRGLNKRFFYPGFTPRTGGLLREPGLLAERESFDAQAWLHAQGIVRRPGERLVSLFCYANPGLQQLLRRLAADAATLLLVCPGPAQRELAGLDVPAGLRWQALPYLSQTDYDRLLWSCELNLVRGEDSFVRAQWAARPLLWQLYPQHDGAHGPKLEAFLDLWLHDADPGLAAGLRQLWRAWNGLVPWGSQGLPALEQQQALARDWSRKLAAQPDLATQLLGFVTESR